MRRSNFALRLQPGLLDDARRAAIEEGVALNQLINVAVAEKVASLRTAAFFRERAARGSVAKALEVLSRAGVGNPPMPGDELPTKGQAKPAQKRSTKSPQRRTAKA
jgi:HicB-like protein involved in pilus formation